MKSGYLLPVVFLLFVSCAGLPAIDPASPTSATAIKDSCSSHFTEGKWRLVHSIEAVLPNGQRQFLIGVSLLDTPKDRIDSAILTVEGLVLFDARYDPSGILTRRAVPPFDSPHFSKAMMDDIKLLFIEPKGDIVEIGTGNDEMPICRYRNRDGSAIDITALHNDRWMITSYNPNAEMKRRIKAEPCRQSRENRRGKFACRMEMSAFGRGPYTLFLKLLEAEALTN